MQHRTVEKIANFTLAHPESTTPVELIPQPLKAGHSRDDGLANEEHHGVPFVEQMDKVLGVIPAHLESTRLPPSELELTEKLEQLRFLENGIPVTVIETSQDTIGVDTKEDFRKVEEYFHRLPREA